LIGEITELKSHQKLVTFQTKLHDLNTKQITEYKYKGFIQNQNSRSNKIGGIMQSKKKNPMIP
jgi:hypothetical protein